MLLKNYLQSLSPEDRQNLADQLGTTEGYLKKLIYVSTSRPSGEMALKIELFSGGAMTRVDIRPDLYVGMVSLSSIAEKSNGRVFNVPCHVKVPDDGWVFKNPAEVSVHSDDGVLLVELPDGSVLSFDSENSCFLSSSVARCAAISVVLRDSAVFGLSAARAAL